MTLLDHHPLLNPAPQAFLDAGVRRRQPVARRGDEVGSAERVPAVDPRRSSASTARRGGMGKSAGIGLLAGALGVVFGDIGTSPSDSTEIAGVGASG